jgi:glutaredoxin-like protein
MSMLQDRDKPRVRERLAAMTGPVTLVNFTQETECQFCRETRELLEDLVGLNDHLRLEVYDLVADADKAKEYGVDKIPATVLIGRKDYGIRYYGVPAGYEFASLLEDILMVSAGDSGLAETTRERLKALTDPVHLQVFVTPTCPYCPGAVRLAHQFAMETEQVTSDMVEATEFPELSVRYQVMGVPKTVANEESAAEGMMPEEEFLEKVLEAAGRKA